MSTSIETSVVNFIEPAIAVASGSGSPLDGIDAHHTPYQVYLVDSGVSVLVHSADVSLTADASDVGEFNGVLPIVCYSRVIGKDKTARHAARDKADAIYKAIAKLIFDDPTIGGAVIYSRPLKVQGGWDVEKGQTYMAVTFELHFNDLTNDLNEE
ncbi:MAG TPA: hypothetical protein VFC63_09805 [Blastocatellia bacterium]|nr:hypothetical protein [Blastocatellia bacterium]